MKIFAFLSAFAAIALAAVGDDCTGSDGGSNSTACASGFTEFCQNDNGVMTCKGTSACLKQKLTRLFFHSKNFKNILGV